MKNYIIIFLLFSFLNQSCKSDKDQIAASTKYIITAIRDSDLISFKKIMGKDFDENGEVNTFYFNVAHNYLNKYFKKGQKIDFIQGERDKDYFVEVSIPIFQGYDSSNGLKKAVLVLTFRPAAPYAPYSKLVEFQIKEDLDVYYRRYLMDHNLLPEY
jgi:hypothetical protein